MVDIPTILFECIRLTRMGSQDLANDRVWIDVVLFLVTQLFPYLVSLLFDLLR
jgi:hypothetical protein